MKRVLPGLSGWIAAAVFGVLAGLPWSYRSGESAGPMVVEITMTSQVASVAQLYFDDGPGFGESQSIRMPVSAAPAHTVLHFPLEKKAYRQLRFDPLMQAGEFVIHQVRLLNAEGECWAEVPLDDFVFPHQIEKLQITPHGLRGETTPQAIDPHLTLPWSPSWVPPPTRIFTGPRLATVWPGFLLALAGLTFSPALSSLARAAGRRARQSPRGALLLTAVVAVVISAYPMVFLGQSEAAQPIVGSPAFGRLDLSVVDAQLQKEALARFELPLWNRHSAAGVPLLAQGRSGWGDPLQLLVWLFGGGAIAWNLKFLAAKLLFCLGVGRFAWQVTAGHLGAALLVTASSAFLGAFGALAASPLYFTLGYLPWILSTWLSAAAAPSARRGVPAWLCLAVVNCIALVSGPWEAALRLTLAVNLIGLVLLACARLPWRERATRLTASACSLLATALLTTPLWLSYLDLRSLSSLPDPSLDLGLVAPGSSLGLFDDGFQRGPALTATTRWPSTNVLMLAGCAALVATWRRTRPDRTTGVLAGAAVAVYALTFGLVPEKWIPPLAGAGASPGFLGALLLVLLLSGLAALGFKNLASRLGTDEGRYDLLAAGVLVAALMGLWLGSVPLSESGNVVGRALSSFSLCRLGALAGALLAGAGLAQLATRRGRLTPPQTLILIACLGVVLWRGGYRTTNASPRLATAFAPRTELRAVPPSVAPLIAENGAPFRVASAPAVSRTYPMVRVALEGIDAPDALSSPHYQELMFALGSENLQSGWDLLGVKYRLAPAPSVTPTDPAPMQVEVTLRESAWPRAYFTPWLERYARAEDLRQRLRTGPPGPFAAVQMGDPAELWSNVPAGGVVAPADRAILPAEAYALSTNETHFTVTTPGPGFAVLHEAWLPGSFRARLNGERAELLRVNHAFKAVRIPAAGTWQVEFAYWPPHFTATLLFSAAGVALLAALAVWSRSRPPLSPS